MPRPAPQLVLPAIAAAFAGYALAAIAVRIDAMPRRPRRGPLGTERAADEPLFLQETRAVQAGRGRDAVTPTAIPLAGWKDIAWRAVHEISADRLMLIAAGVVFYGMLATVPAITALVSLYGLFTPAKAISGHLAFLADIIPKGAYDLVSGEVVRIAGKSDGKLSLAFVFGLGVAIWSANAGMKAIFDALNVVYDEDEKRGIIRLNATSLAFTAAAIIAVLLALGAVVALPLVLAFAGFQAEYYAGALPVLRWPALFVLMVLGLALLYRFGPSRRAPKWRWLSVGSVFAAAAWIAVSLAFSWYLSRFADYNATYGALGAVIGLMMWMWVSTLVVLIGAELNSEIEHQTARDSTVGADKPLGARGAVMADTVGAAQS